MIKLFVKDGVKTSVAGSCTKELTSEVNKNTVTVVPFKITLWPLFMDGVQLPQSLSHFEEAVYFLPLSSHKFLVLILSTLEEWKAESTLEPRGGSH